MNRHLVCGIIVLASIFAGLAACLINAIGWKLAFGGFAGSMLFTGLLAFGLYLIRRGMNP